MILYEYFAGSSVDISLVAGLSGAARVAVKADTHLLLAVVIGIDDARDGYGLLRLVRRRAAASPAVVALLLSLVLLAEEGADQLVHIEGLLLLE